MPQIPPARPDLPPVSAEEMRENLETYTWPMTSAEFATLLRVPRSTAAMRLKKLVSEQRLQKLEHGAYGLPGAQYGATKTMGQIRDEVSTLPWPMTRPQFVAYYRQQLAGQDPAEAAAERDETRVYWFDTLIKEGRIVKVEGSLYAPPGVPVVTLPPEQHVALHPEADNRVRFFQVLATLPDEFTSAMFVQAANLDAKHASSVLSRLEKTGRIKRIARGRYLRDRPALPGKFTTTQFAAHFGLDANAAEQRVGELVGAGLLTRLSTTHFKGTKAQIEQIRAQLLPAAAAPFDYERMRERQADLPDLPLEWPITVQSYAQHYGISLQAARQSLKRFTTIGLLREERQGRKAVYHLIPGAKLKVAPREAQRLVAGHLTQDDSDLSVLPPSHAPALQEPEQAVLEDDDFSLPPARVAPVVEDDDSPVLPPSRVRR